MTAGYLQSWSHAHKVPVKHTRFPWRDTLMSHIPARHVSGSFPWAPVENSGALEKTSQPPETLLAFGPYQFNTYMYVCVHNVFFFDSCFVKNASTPFSVRWSENASLSLCAESTDREVLRWIDGISRFAGLEWKRGDETDHVLSLLTLVLK